MSYQNTDSSIEILTNSDPQQPVNGDQNIRINR